METSKTGPGRRRARQQRQRLLTSFNQSQLTQHDFATQPGVGLSTLDQWLHLERDAILPKVRFQAVPEPIPATRWPVEVVSPQGGVVRLKNNLDVQQLRSRLRALPS